ncbi:MAG TPA: winged helix DNA-binding protein [Methylomirabilota bacterium]|jgi:DNA-binding MarR family transcriptional regulator|nr:winged helix DNA-binding protein [Methylomirabilota bacterium]
MNAFAHNTQPKATIAAELQEFFYPIHYQIGMALEDALRGGLITRKQSAILWLIRSAGEGGRCMRRKDIVRLMQSWFEVTSSALSKAIRGMARPPLSLVQITEDPRSAREKLITLTPKGERFVEAMAARGESFLQDIVQHLPADVIHGGIAYLQQLTAAFNRSCAEKERRLRQERAQRSALIPRHRMQLQRRARLSEAS